MGCSSGDPPRGAIAVRNGDSLVLELGNVLLTCDAPDPALPCVSAGVDAPPDTWTRYKVDIPLTPSEQEVGAIALVSLGTLPTYSALSQPQSDMTCDSDGGDFTLGTLEITDVEATHLAFSLSHTMAFKWGTATADGTYTATICP